MTPGGHLLLEGSDFRLCRLNGALQHAGLDILDQHQEEQTKANIAIDHVDHVDQCIERHLQADQCPHDAKHTQQQSMTKAELIRRETFDGGPEQRRCRSVDGCEDHHRDQASQ